MILKKRLRKKTQITKSISKSGYRKLFDTNK